MNIANITVDKEAFVVPSNEQNLFETCTRFGIDLEFCKFKIFFSQFLCSTICHFWLFLILSVAGSFELLEASPPGPPTGLCPGPTGGFIKPQLYAAMTFGNGIVTTSCLQKSTAFFHSHI